MTHVDDWSWAGEVSSERSRIARLPVPSLVAAQRDKITALLRARATRHDGEAPNDGEVGAAGLPRQRRHRAPVDGGQGAMR